MCLESLLYKRESLASEKRKTEVKSSLFSTPKQKRVLCSSALVKARAEWEPWVVLGSVRREWMRERGSGKDSRD